MRSLIDITGGELHPVTVTGPDGEPVSAAIGLLGGAGPRSAVIDISDARQRPAPIIGRSLLYTTSYGAGELIAAALDLGVSRILIRCDDSGACDGGAGMAEAIGARLLDAAGRPIVRGGEALLDLDSIDLRGLDPRLAGVQIDVACNYHHVLCGARGAAQVFGRRHAASPAEIKLLAAALEHYAAGVWRSLGHDVRLMPGGGAAGGLGAGLRAILGATLHRRYAIVRSYVEDAVSQPLLQLEAAADPGRRWRRTRGLEK